MPELMAILVAKREREHEERKFFAAIQGIDIDKNSSQGQKAWEDMKERVFSGNTAKDSSDIVSLQGINAQQAGFGIGQGLEYEVVKDPKNPMS
jgi:translation initiation factor 1 (eIF-1/SUI1)